MQEKAIKANEIVIFSISEVSNRDGNTEAYCFVLKAKQFCILFNPESSQW